MIDERDIKTYRKYITYRDIALGQKKIKTSNNILLGTQGQSLNKRFSINCWPRKKELFYRCTDDVSKYISDTMQFLLCSPSFLATATDQNSLIARENISCR